MSRSLLATSVMVSVALTGLAACSDAGDEPHGTIELNLVGQAPSGAVYRLRDATIVVTGPTSMKYWFTEDAPDRTQLSANVVVGDYSSTLQPGWRLERVEGPSTTTVPAELKSANPILFAVQDSQRTNVPLQFRVFGEDVDMSQGYDIVLEIEECKPQEDVCTDGADNDCDGTTDCADSDCAGTLECAVCGNGTVEAGEECDDGNNNGGDGCSAVCQSDTTSEVEPNNTLTDATGNTVQITGDATIQGAITPLADLDIYRVTVATPTVIRFETFTSLFDCTPAAATIDLRLFDSAGTAILADTFGMGIGQCGAIVFFLNAGTYFVRVEERGNNATIGTYFLQVDYQGNRGAESEPPTPPTIPGSNDSVDTADRSLLAGNNVFVFGNHLDIDDADVYAITVPGGARIRAEIIEGDRAVETCESNGIDSQLTLFNAAGAQLATDDDAGRGFCSLIDGSGTTPLYADARNNSTTAQTFYLMVRRSSLATGSQQVFAYRLQVTFR